MQRGVYGPRAANGELANSLENLGHALARRGERGDLDAAKRHLETSFVMRLALENGQEYPLVRTLGKLAGGPPAREWTAGSERRPKYRRSGTRARHAARIAIVFSRRRLRADRRPPKGGGRVRAREDPPRRPAARDAARRAQEGQGRRGAREAEVVISAFFFPPRRAGFLSPFFR